MTLPTAVLIQLFTKGPRPIRSLILRSIGFIAGVSLVAVLTWRFTPIGELHALPVLQVSALCMSTTFFMTALLSLLTHGYQINSLHRLTVLDHLPLRRMQLLGARTLSFLPLAFISLVICSAMAYKFFNPIGWLPPVAWLLAFACQMVGRIVLPVIAQQLTLGFLLLSGVLSWLLYRPQANKALFAVLCALAAAQIVCVVWALYRPPGVMRSPWARRVVESTRLNVVTAYILRALRTRRFKGAHLLLAVLCVSLSWLSARTGTVPFDAVVVAVLIFLGAIGQDVRSLSNQRQVLELVYYGVLRSWLAGMGLLVASGLALWLVILWFLAELVFTNQLGTSWMHAVSVAVTLASVGWLAGCVAAPRSTDLLAQLSAAGLYALGVYGVFKLFSIADESWTVWLAGTVTCTSIGCIYVVERFRWLKAIRR